MSWIGEGVAVAVMRGKYENRAAGARDAVKFFDGGDHVANVLDQMFGAHLIEGVVSKRKPTLIEIAEDVSGGVWIHIEADGTGILRWPAAHVQNSRQSILRIG